MGSGYNMYNSLPPEYLKSFGRTFDWHMLKDKEPDLLSLVWSTDRENSYNSFLECYNSWMEKAWNDPDVDLYEKFHLPRPELGDITKE